MTSTNPVSRIILLGLRFHSDDIKVVLSKSGRKRPGPVTDKLQWRMFWHEVIRLVQNGRTDLGLLQDPGLNSKEKLTRHIQVELNKDEQISDPTLTELTAQVQRRLPFNLGEEAILEEVQKLRQMFELTRKKATRA